MLNPEVRLEEQLVDVRSDQIAYKLTVSNADSTSLRLLSVQPRVPIGASLLEVTDSSLAQANAQKARLLDELNRLLRQYLWVTSAPFRQEWIDQQRTALRELFSVVGFLSVYFSLFFRNSSLQARMKREFETFSFNVASAADARAAYTKWMEASTSYEAVRSLFDEKTKQLERIESRMDEGERPGLTNVPAGGFFTATYVMRFDRKLFEPKKYQVAFEIAHSQADAAPQTASVATNVQISPYPMSLSLVAIVAAVLGVLVRTAVTPESQPFAQMLSLAQSGQLLVGPIVALIFFNMYEYTSVGKDLNIGVSWRSALLIGALSGLAHDKILSAIKALIGA
jgi:hypothetical protein